MNSTNIKLTIAIVSATSLICATDPASAQSGASAAVSADLATPSSPATSKTEQKKQAKAEHKAERKAAHAKNVAELKKLEDNGYQPSATDADYPQKLQNAERKANTAAAGSQ